jgi:hypothetical protein
VDRGHRADRRKDRLKQRGWWAQLRRTGLQTARGFTRQHAENIGARLRSLLRVRDESTGDAPSGHSLPCPLSPRRTCPTETGLAGWAFRIRTGESVRALSDWNCVTTSPEVSASRRRRRFACELRNTDLQLRPRFQQTILGRKSSQHHAPAFARLALDVGLTGLALGVQRGEGGDRGYARSTCGCKWRSSITCQWIRSSRPLHRSRCLRPLIAAIAVDALNEWEQTTRAAVEHQRHPVAVRSSLAS